MKEGESWRMARTAPGVLLFGALLAVGCQEPGSPVTDTEIWRLELEQVDDGTSAVFRRRGTINLRLRMNRRMYRDPGCTAPPGYQATDFLADVEAIPSRLQPPATGTASGTWNCRGFLGEVRLNDGTTYTLRSDRTIPYVGGVYLDSDTLPHTWEAGPRRGHFLFSRESLFEYAPFDSHMDVRVQNRNQSAVELILENLGLWVRDSQQRGEQ